MSDSLNVRSATIAHKNKIKNLNEKNQNELEKIKLAHQERKGHLRSDQREQTQDLKLRHRSDLMELAHKQEKTLEKMRAALEEAKARTEEEKEELTNSRQSELEATKAKFQEKLASLKEKQRLLLNDVNDQGNYELNRLRRSLESEESELRSSFRSDKRNLEAKEKTELGMSKTLYKLKKDSAQDKYVAALAKQKSENSKTLANEEKNHQKALENRFKSFQKEITRIEKDGEFKRAQAKTAFEKSFAKILNGQENTIAELKSRKESIIQGLRNEILDAYKLDASKEGDPFYTTTSLEPGIEKKDNSYIITVEAPPEDAKNLNLNVHKRSVTLTMNRRFENTRNDDGAVEQVNKVETLTRKFSVDDILDPTKIKKSYKDGITKFEIPLA